MLYIFHGSDTDKARAKAHVFLEALFKKRSDAQLFRMDADSFDIEELKRLTQERGLFEEKHVVFLDHISEESQHTDAFRSMLADVAQSPNMFVVLEGKITKSDLKPFEKYAEDTYIFEKPKQTKKQEEFNVFSLTDALCARNKGKVWALYHQALLAGKTPEEIHGLLHWQIKSMLLAQTATSAKQAGLNPFVYKKSRTAAEKFGKEELSVISKQLVSTYHESRKGEGNLAENLELLILRVL